MNDARLGILMLDTRFPRVLGDVGHPDSFDFPVRYAIVPGATPEAIVLRDQRVWVDAFIEAGCDLVRAGCKGLATTCGFLTLVRDEVEQACGVPVAASSLEQVQDLLAPGILTISVASLSPAHLAAANVPERTPVQGVDCGSFARSILQNATTLDVDAARIEIVAGAERLCAAYPHIRNVVLECTNMPPYADAIATATGRPVYSILTHLNAFHKRL